MAGASEYGWLYLDGAVTQLSGAAGRAAWWHPGQPPAGWLAAASDDQGGRPPITVDYWFE